MATREELTQALRNAHKAGDQSAARRLAAMLNNMQGDSTPPTYAEQVIKDSQALPWYSGLAQTADDLIRVYSNGLTLNGADKFAGYMGGNTDEQRKLTQDARIRLNHITPYSAEAMDFGGAATLGVGTAPFSAMAPLLSRVPAASGAVGRGLVGSTVAGAEGAGMGAVNAYNLDQDMGDGAVSGALGGVAGLAASNAIGSGVNAVANKIRPNPNTMGPDELRAAKNNAYNAVAQSGVEYSSPTVQGFLTGMDDALVNARANRANHSAAFDALDATRNRLTSTRRPVPLDEIDAERQALRRDVLNNPDPAVSYMGNEMIGALDAAQRNVGVRGVTSRSASPEEGMRLLDEARDLNQRFRKTEELTQIVDNAESRAARNLSSGADSTIKQNIGSILANPAKRRGYTPDELAMMQRINDGTLGSNILRQVGRMAPGGGMSLGAGGIAGTIGASLGGPVGALAAMAPAGVGALAKNASSRITRRSTDELLDLVSSGSRQAATPNAPMGPEQIEALRRTLGIYGLQD